MMRWSQMSSIENYYSTVCPRLGYLLKNGGLFSKLWIFGNVCTLLKLQIG